jgi:hypothetical protein
MGSANFKNPEFRLTCFADLPDSQVIHGKQIARASSHKRDLAMIERFEKFVADRDSSRPFFSFMFLDSTHSPYRFQTLPGFEPPFKSFHESVRHEKLASDQDERRQALARYRNSAAYIDHLIWRALQALEKKGQLQNTIVMIAGDHGEEFGEHGFFGHNSSYDDVQLVTPFIFHYPGVKPRTIDYLISSNDWAPTTLRLLGVTNDPADYCQGYDILGNVRRRYVVAASYSSAGIVADNGYRLAFPLEYYRLSTIDVYDADYREPANRQQVLEQLMPYLSEVYRSSGRFKR